MKNFKGHDYAFMVAKLHFWGFQSQNISIETLQRARKTFESFQKKLSPLLSMLFQFFVFVSKHRKFHRGIDYNIILQAFVFSLNVMQFKSEVDKWREIALLRHQTVKGNINKICTVIWDVRALQQSFKLSLLSVSWERTDVLYFSHLLSFFLLPFW